MKVGDQVKVKVPVLVYTHPEHRNEAHNIEGMEGEIEQILLEWHGKPISANFPYKVKFDRRFKAHLSEEELAVL